MAVDITGRRFGKLVAVEPTDQRKGSSIVWRCKCDCGGEKLAPIGYLRHGLTSCGCARRQHYQFGKPKSAEYKLLYSAFSRAKAVGLEFNLTINDVHIPKTCPLLGIPLFKGDGVVGSNSPSIDRIDPSKGYVRENVWVVSHKAYSMKAAYSLDEYATLTRNWQVRIATGRPNSGNLVYLASPYTHSDKMIEAQRYEQVLDAWKWLIDNHRDLHFFAPIIQSHQLCLLGMPGDWKFWADFDGTMISKCQEFWVVCMPGYRESVGVKAERRIADKLCLPVRFLIPNPNGFRVVVEDPGEAALYGSVEPGRVGHPPY